MKEKLKNERKINTIAMYVSFYLSGLCKGMTKKYENDHHQAESGVQAQDITKK